MSKVKAVVLTHKDCPLDVLTKAYIAEEDLRNIREAFTAFVYLETCNRVEFYIDGNDDERCLVELRRMRTGISPRVLVDKNAVRHLLEVVSGLDSMFLGEREILSQVKKAFKSGKLNQRLSILFNAAIKFGEFFRHKFGIGDISFVKFLAGYIMENSRPTRVLVIGGGEVARGIARELIRRGYEVTIANRTLDRLRREFGGKARLITLEELPREVEKGYEIIVAAISAGKTLLDLDALENGLSLRLIIDVSVPCVIESKRYKVMKLQDLVMPYTNYISGRLDFEKARALIEEEAERIMRLLLREDAHPLIRRVMRFAEGVRRAEVEEAIKAIRRGEKIEDVLEAMSRSLLKKLLHNLFEGVKELCENGKEELAEYLVNIITGSASPSS